MSDPYSPHAPWRWFTDEDGSVQVGYRTTIREDWQVFWALDGEVELDDKATAAAICRALNAAGVAPRMKGATGRE